MDRACETSVTFLAPSATGTSRAAGTYAFAAPDVFSLLPPPALCHHRHSFAFYLSGFNIFNFPQHSEVLKHRFEAVKEKKSVSEFQREYLEFEFEYGEFLEKTSRFSPSFRLENTEKAGLPHGSPAWLLQRYDIFRRKANSVKNVCVEKKQVSPTVEAGRRISETGYRASSFVLKAKAYMRICLIMAKRPLLRVGERCSVRPMRAMK